MLSLCAAAAAAAVRPCAVSCRTAPQRHALSSPAAAAAQRRRRRSPPPPPAAANDDQLPAAAAAAAADGASSPSSPPLPPPQAVEDQRLWSEVEAAVHAAEDLEAQGRIPAAVEGLQKTLAELEARHGAPSFDLIVLRQALWDLLFASGRHSEALRQAAAVHMVVSTRFGAGSAESHMVGVRLGMSVAACGRVEDGLRLIYEATPVLQHNLSQLLGQAAVAGSAGELPEEQALALQDSADRLAAALGEGNFYGSLLTLRRAAEAGRQADVVQGWEELDGIVLAGFSSLLVSNGGVGGGTSGLAFALRTHEGLAAELAADALLGRLLADQNRRLHEVAAQGLAHPSFFADERWTP